MSSSDSAYGAFGGPGYCCNVCANDTEKLCCPNGGGPGGDDMRLDRPAPDSHSFLSQNICPACIAAGSCSSGGLQLDNIQTDGPKVRLG